MSRAWAGGSSRAWRQVRAQVLERDGWVCQLRSPGCTVTATQVDHIVPLAVDDTGRVDPSNLRAVCRSCNLRRNRRGRRYTPVEP